MDTYSRVDLGGILLFTLGCLWDWTDPSFSRNHSLQVESKPSGTASINNFSRCQNQDGLHEVSVWLQWDPGCWLFADNAVGLRFLGFSFLLQTYSVASVEIPQGWCTVINAALLQFHFISVECWCHEILWGPAEKRFRVDPQVTRSAIMEEDGVITKCRFTLKLLSDVEV